MNARLVKFEEYTKVYTTPWLYKAYIEQLMQTQPFIYGLHLNFLQCTKKFGD